jgi:hypothetical protein
LAFKPSEKERYFGLGRRAAELNIYPKVPPLEQKTDIAVAERLDASPWLFDVSGVKEKR